MPKDSISLVLLRTAYSKSYVYNSSYSPKQIINGGNRLTHKSSNLLVLDKQTSN